jgi:methylenetetrahydrofolate dehydrogenase (NADP+)/methenyltetrahydrofolate cyclohydrolase
MNILDGKALSEKIKNNLKTEVENLQKEHNIIPGLAVVLVGSDPASATYVKMKAKSCKDVGIYSIVHEMPTDITEQKILETINMMNKNPNIHGILIQLPLPSHIDTNKVIEAIDPAKDVDGFHAFNIGRVVTNLDSFVPATPMGVMTLLDEYNIELQGKNAVVVGASNIVGKPMSALLLNQNATVTTCHIYTKDLKSIVKQADIICVGVGKPNLITEDMVKDGAIVIDIGINRLKDGRLVGDVDFDNVSKKCSHITPVPGGVGPMTIASLLQNTVKSAKQFINK